MSIVSSSGPLLTSHNFVEASSQFVRSATSTVKNDIFTSLGYHINTSGDMRLRRKR
ncbi:hypothetical protein CGRA01v4_10585 [Colletotrichum graminicola]|nr:hypothetical protein CGRA01v4_10585 [Colletotrichum graminicola]